jgi:hypothetical protein
VRILVGLALLAAPALQGPGAAAAGYVPARTPSRRALARSRRGALIAVGVFAITIAAFRVAYHFDQ